MKPIEPGCMALTYNCWNPENNGKTVRAIKYIGNHPNEAFSSDKYWITDTYYTPVNKLGHKFQPDNHWPEENLLRIDGYEEDKSIEEISKELVK